MATSNVFVILAHDGFELNSLGTTAFNLPGAIEVLDFNFDVHQVGSEPSGRPRSVEGVERTQFTFKKAMDGRSPKLFRMCCDGTYITQAECQIYGPTNKPYLVYHMAHVHIGTYHAEGGSDLPTETIGLTFGEMGVKFDYGGVGEENQGNGSFNKGSLTEKWSWVLEMGGLDLTTKIRELSGQRFSS